MMPLIYLPVMAVLDCIVSHSIYEYYNNRDKLNDFEIFLTPRYINWTYQQWVGSSSDRTPAHFSLFRKLNCARILKYSNKLLHISFLKFEVKFSVRVGGGWKLRGLHWFQQLETSPSSPRWVHHWSLSAILPLEGDLMRIDSHETFQALRKLRISLEEHCSETECSRFRTIIVFF